MIEKNNLLILSDSKDLDKFCKEVIKENAQAVKDYKAGNDKSIP